MLILNDFKERLLPLRSQMVVRNTWLQQRLDEVLPEIMQREAIDLWLVIAREYNEDPVIMTMIPEPSMAARRRTILLFFRRSDGSVERLSVDRYGYGEFYPQAWSPDKEEQYECVARLIRERNPQVIGMNTSEHFAFGDGISYNEHQVLLQALDPVYRERVCSAERLCLGWLERRIEPELVVYPGLVEMGHALIAEAFSRRLIQPGITTADDVVWWFRQKMHDTGLKAWFQPSVEVQSPGQTQVVINRGERRHLIMPGDVLHCDVGFYYLGLATDQQQHAYVRRPGEIDVPEGLKAALKDGNRLQDIHMDAMRIGCSGNEILQKTLKQAKSEGILPQVYSHPLGYHGHAAGPTIGLWDMQDGVPGKGDYEVFDQTCYSIELNIRKNIPEWDDQEIRIALEEDAVLENGKMCWLHGRQTEFHLI